MQGLLGKKIGMTRVFDAQGRQIPVTAIECGPCVVLQLKCKEKEGYEAVQLAFDNVSERRLSRPQLGRFKKLNLPPRRFCCEMAVEPGDAYKEGEVITVALFDKVPAVDVVGISKGRGFQGPLHRHGMRGGAMTHGGHSKRRIGSIGCRELPGRIHKGKRMPGHMGVDRVTCQNLEVVSVRGAENLILVKGAVPGAAGSVVLVKKALKKKGRKS